MAKYKVRLEVNFTTDKPFDPSVWGQGNLDRTLRGMFDLKDYGRLEIEYEPNNG